MTGMTRKLKEILKQAEMWPEGAQEELADAANEIAAALGGEYHPTADELAGIERGLRDAEQGRFATEQEVQAIFDQIPDV